MPTLCRPYSSLTSLPSQDIDGLDTAIPRSLMSMVRTAIASIEIITVIAWATPSFLFSIGPLLFIYAAVLVRSC